MTIGQKEKQNQYGKGEKKSMQPKTKVTHTLTQMLVRMHKKKQLAKLMEGNSV